MPFPPPPGNWAEARLDSASTIVGNFMFGDIELSESSCSKFYLSTREGAALDYIAVQKEAFAV
jgi:hypothetical protein